MEKYISLEKQMCFGIALALSLTMLSPANSQFINRDNLSNPFADNKRLSTIRTIAIDSLRALNDAIEGDFCTKRYGTGYKVYPDPNGQQGQFVTDMGHKFFLYARSEVREDHIYAEHSQLLTTFPGDPDKQFEVTQYVTGFIDSKIYSGVFSDGSCSGKFTVVDAK
ncbi:hypothetical protein PsAD2_00322 [Pseudovibrio axinellae]|uniref:Uncharacterized protein n=1 Tax=Pseudovibrio axinellae TaxID=989403 RepID=A0A166B506_9HYPH|nr:hypothetical protein [Pseudovibrio axinellae]KZL21893.1 hypothetical protein PsAD2_00322 [Pseudovibrio axinellae]SEQ82691.1 hypothetical protein SAMN05421798_104320 [Pseudovibrio axinellae]